MRLIDTAKKPSAPLSVLVGVFIIYLGILALSYYKGQIIRVHPGFNICRNDCTQYHRLSDYILKNKKLYPAYFDGSYHSSYFFIGYTLLVAAVKAFFGKSWQMAYTLLNGLFTVMLAFFSSRVLSRKNWILIIFITSMAFILANRYINNYSRTLLPDYIFAMGTGATFLLLVSGFTKRKRSLTAAALVLAAFMLFIKPNGVLLLVFSCVFFLIQYLPERFQRVTSLTAPIVAGLIIFFLSSGLTAYMAKNSDNLHSFPKFSQKVFSQILEINYLGDNIIHKRRIGTGIVGFPYGYWIRNDGSLTAIMASLIQRIPRAFEIPIPVYDKPHNFVRYAYYGPLYLLFLVYLVYSIRVKSQEPQYLLMASLIIGYLISFISISHIESRYLLTFDVCMLLCSSFMVYKIIEFFLLPRKNHNLDQT